MNRGRSRAVSNIAIARKASEERTDDAHTPPLARSPSPLSSGPASRDPSPPRPLSLSDRVHIAYAHDDIHLAKVLLLRLQGIDVTSDSDPRIAAVKDEDFDAPPRALHLPSQVEQATRHHGHAQADARRADALRAKELLWETEARRYTEERVRSAAAKRRQHALSAEQDRVRLAKQKEAAAAAVDLRRRRTKPTARTLNFSLVAPVPPPPPKFTYDFPFTPRTIATPRVALTPRRPSAEEPAPPPEPARAPNRITFQQVLARMDGPLFPVLPCERTPRMSADRRERALLNALLAAGADLSRRRTGKARAVPLRCAVCAPPPPPPPPPAPSPSSAPSTPSTASSGLSRAGSWLSFSSRASTSTAPSSWASSPSLSSDAPPPSLKRLWLPGARRTASPAPSLSSPAPAPARTAAPAPPSLSSPRPPTRSSPPPHPRPRARRPPHPDPHTDTDDAQAGAGALGRLLALARNLQAAYVRAVVVGYGTGGWDGEEGDGYTFGAHDVYGAREEYGYGGQHEKPHAPAPPAARCTLRARPAGRRAECGDVRRFLAASPSSSPASSASPLEDAEDLAPTARLAPLRRPCLRPFAAPTPSRRTPHAPYALVFPPAAPLVRSPWAPLPLARECAASLPSYGVDAGMGTGGLGGIETDDEEWTRARPALRARAVPNGAFLRVRALHNGARGLAVVPLPAPPLKSHSPPRDSAHPSSNARSSSSPNASPSPIPIPLSLRRPRECLVAFGVDRVPGSRLRFVYAGVDVGA
ncbi:hypothetical protein B0H17DRAFT_1180855 [Mycena rosella]|uniref:Uncharacterized protein n=1 Tax=Mycena rosella TaxID=1033263 RepID=A0AAD7GG72_MYCRO|nr:hypothetical protein B0H17DRAFT_1180855 [Mycena rosella]